MKIKNLVLALTLAIAATCISCTGSKMSDFQVPEISITAPPAELCLPAFYTQYADVNGIPLLASPKVSREGFEAAYRTLYAMTSCLAPEILEAMREEGARVAIMWRYEGTTDIPEHAWMRSDTTLNWDLRARGLEGTMDCPLTTCAEENLLALQIDKYHAEDILIHEFAHAIQLIGIHKVYPGIDDELQRKMDKAIAKGLWYNTYTIDNYQDYFAEGVQDWFNVNAEMPWHDGKHCYVNTREELRRYDPALYRLLKRYFPKTDVQISRHPKVNLYTHEYPRETPAYKADMQNYTITAPPAALGLDPWYSKYTVAGRIPICSSRRTPDSCIVQAARVIESMMSCLPADVADAMVKVGTRVTVMARYEGTLDVPEHACLASDTTLNWNVRARGLGGTLEEPMSSCAEENILAYQIDQYHAEDILIHEFAHSIHLIGIEQVDPGFDAELAELLQKALAEGKWAGTYAGTCPEEYWAEGVQDWFDVNAEAPAPDGKHNAVNTREELKAYDPGLYALLARYFPADAPHVSLHPAVNLYR